MTINRRYYWIKLKEDFFTDKRIKRLRKLSGGDTYTIIYLKLLLLSLKDDGKLFYDEVETSFIKELALTIDEGEDDIGVTLNYLFQQGLLKVITENEEYFLTEIPTLIGSETASTRRSRRSREVKNEQKVLQCNTNATPCNILQQNCNGEIEKDIELEKEKEGEIEENAQFYGEYKNIRLSYEEYQNLQDKLHSYTDIMIEKLSRYIKSTGKTYKDHYVTIINWYEQDKEKLTKKNKIYSSDYEASTSL